MVLGIDIQMDLNQNETFCDAKNRKKSVLRLALLSVTLLSQLSPELFDPRKVDPKFLEANSEYFILSTARDDKRK